MDAEEETFWGRWAPAWLYPVLGPEPLARWEGTKTAFRWVSVAGAQGTFGLCLSESEPILEWKGIKDPLGS